MAASRHPAVGDQPPDQARADLDDVHVGQGDSQFVNDMHLHRRAARPGLQVGDVPFPPFPEVEARPFHQMPDL